MALRPQQVEVMGGGYRCRECGAGDFIVHTVDGGRAIYVECWWCQRWDLVMRWSSEVPRKDVLRR